MAAHCRLALVLAALLGEMTPAWGLIPGGAFPRSDCLAEWSVTTRSLVATRGTSVLDCQDGDPSCDADGRADGQCTFNVSICILQNDPMRPECVPPRALSALRRPTSGLEMPTSLSR